MDTHSCLLYALHELIPITVNDFIARAYDDLCHMGKNLGWKKI